MFTENALKKARIDLYNIVANHSKEDYQQANYKNGKRKRKKHIPYSLGIETERAREIYHLVYGKNPEDITQDQEEEIKGFLMIYRLNRTEYLQEAGGSQYFTGN